MLLYPSPVSSRMFTVMPSDRNVLVAEASDLGPDFKLGRVYDDACDVGFTVVSARTGLEAVFTGGVEHRDSEGELLWEEFEITPESARSLGCSPDFRIQLFND